ncbi:MAG: deoxyribodipyrimidine photo-lyase [Ignavibacteria bacterium]|jgi:deoxyribodipyrimidine photo-lyase|nr:deoxyribodipyrimidine photo-lyase [Ignavibacteria bacterium]MCU7499181.1 deoxyribodipyrimidine photo-lyase [Ignavibacteria bacterium]MCU7513616.1 deoxyribodipyrimidine photo-lyase [Ignavibacteria bacterium]MCU7520142.1 deoxyribodipyrimidine photo-lyase [Ignavibacteria bacterium]MCU7525704.1 deoxyribodipyrimidine photo-lyase [Ignavibacteria bacterium]
MNLKRVRVLKEGTNKPGAVIYWMSRDQRVYDNWAFIFAQELALKQKRPLAVVFCLVPAFLDAAYRQYAFMLKGLKEAENELRLYNVPFHILTGEPKDVLVKFISKMNAAAVVTDFDPLRIKRKWKNEVASKTDVHIYEVDAHNIVPCWVASTKQEFAAYTFRPKINRHLAEFLEDFPLPVKMPENTFPMQKEIDWSKIEKSLKIDYSVKEADWLTPGEGEALRTLNVFIETKAALYTEERNNPNKNVQSNLSPYLHFGQIASQRVALNMGSFVTNPGITEAFLEELIVRKELADNFCCYNENYDSFDGFPEWAKYTLNEHRADPRECIYSLEEFEKAHTHDNLWNAAQIEMVTTGKMHGYLRMYWAKKILEWTTGPEEAMKIAVYLNDKYSLDGRDPNGYTGIAWSIGGVHDRGWGERKVYGKIRYMSQYGCRRKFDAKSYINKYLGE